MKNNKRRGGEGRGGEEGLKREGGLIREGAYLREGGLEIYSMSGPRKMDSFDLKLGIDSGPQNQVSLKFLLPGRKTWNWVRFYSFDF